MMTAPFGSHSKLSIDTRYALSLIAGSQHRILALEDPSLSECMSIPVSGQSIPHTSRHGAPAPACRRSREPGGAVCSWPACPPCCCRPGGPPASPPAGRGCGGSGERFQEPTAVGERQGEGITQRNNMTYSTRVRFICIPVKQKAHEDNLQRNRRAKKVET